MKVASDRRTLTKQRLVRAIGQRTRQTNHAVETILQALIQIVSDHLAEGGRVELENFITVDVHCGKRLVTERAFWKDSIPSRDQHQSFCTLRCRPGKHLRARLKTLSQKQS